MRVDVTPVKTIARICVKERSNPWRKIFEENRLNKLLPADEHAP